MPLSRIEKPYFKSEESRVVQGDILRDVTIVEWVRVIASGELEISERVLGYCTVLTQDCDLEQDFNNRSDLQLPNDDKYLQSILVCPAYIGQLFRAGDHLKDVNLRMQSFTNDPWRKLTSNNLYRYHYLSALPELGIPDLVLDFKHYFTVPRDTLYLARANKSYVGTISELFREDLSQRFAAYLSRIGLPVLPV